MEEPPPVLDSKPEAPQPHAISLAARLLNVFAIPGDVFAGVKASRISIWNWLVPAFLLAAIGVFTAIVVVSQPVFQRQMQELTEKKAKALDQEVKAGKVKQQDVDNALAVLRAITRPASLKSLCSVAAGLLGFARVFWWAFVLWLLSRAFLKVRFGYSKALEIAGLSLMINVLGAVVMLLLMVNLPKLFTTYSMALAISDFDATRQSTLLLGAANLFSFWLLVVLAVGLAKIAGVPFLRAAWLVFAAWAVQQTLFLLVGGMLLQLFL